MEMAHLAIGIAVEFKAILDLVIKHDMEHLLEDLDLIHQIRRLQALCGHKRRTDIFMPQIFFGTALAGEPEERALEDHLHDKELLDRNKRAAQLTIRIRALPQIIPGINHQIALHIKAMQAEQFRKFRGADNIALKRFRHGRDLIRERLIKTGILDHIHIHIDQRASELCFMRANLFIDLAQDDLSRTAGINPTFKGRDHLGIHHPRQINMEIAEHLLEILQGNIFRLTSAVQSREFIDKRIHIINRIAKSIKVNPVGHVILEVLCILHAHLEAKIRDRAAHRMARS